MLTKEIWKGYLSDPELEFEFRYLVTGNLITVMTPFLLLFDLFFIVPEIIIYRKKKKDGSTK